MAQVQRPLRADAARGRVENEVFSNSLGLSIVRKFTPPSNPRTALQQAARAAFYYRQNWFLRGWNDYPILFQGAPSQDIVAYQQALSRQRELNPVTRKSYGAGFQSGSVLERPFYISKMAESDISARKANGTSIRNEGATAFRFTTIGDDGTILQADVQVSPNSSQNVTNAPQAVVFSINALGVIAGDNLNDITDAIQTQGYPASIIAATGWNVAQIQPAFS